MRVWCVCVYACQRPNAIKGNNSSSCLNGELRVPLYVGLPRYAVTVVVGVGGTKVRTAVSASAKKGEREGALQSCRQFEARVWYWKDKREINICNSTDINRCYTSPFRDARQKTGGLSSFRP